MRYDFLVCVINYQILCVLLNAYAYVDMHLCMHNAHTPDQPVNIKINGHQINYAFLSLVLVSFHALPTSFPFMFECALSLCLLQSTVAAHVKYETNMWWCMLKCMENIYIYSMHSIRLKCFSVFSLMLWDNNLY